MADSHPELETEQAHVDHAYRRLEEARTEAIRLKGMVEVGKGGTNQARWEREIFYQNIAERLRQLDIGSQSLCFGRIDQTEEAGAGAYHIGRLAIASESQDPLIVDWRAPVAEAFYRATGADPVGLVRRRHFTSRGQELLALEDEFFGEATTGDGPVIINGRELRGEGALINALTESRTGRLGDVLGTIQAEQDEIIRAELPGVLVVQGGPGTGKTVVALHRAAYLLYTHRFPLEGQGVLVIGPNRVFLSYIEQVLPSLGESGVEVSVLADLVAGVRVSGRDNYAAARIKGDLRMAKVVERAVLDRQRPLRSDLVVGFGARRLRLTVAQSAAIVEQARRRFSTHNRGRKFVESEVFAALAATHGDDIDPQAVREQVSGHPDVREALLWMWPKLRPAQLLYDLYGSRSLLASAGRALTSDDREALYRPWREDKRLDKVIWTVDDVPVLDEAREKLGALPRARKRPIDDEFADQIPETDDEVRTYGHIVVDESQDLSPMQLRMLCRRSLNGSMTIVGDIAQSTGAWAHSNWDEILEHLPERRPSRMAELTVGYRIPAPIMELASKVLVEAGPGLSPPVSVRSEGDKPCIVPVDQEQFLVKQLVETTAAEIELAGSGNVALICPQNMYQALVLGFQTEGVDFGRGDHQGLEQQLTIMPIHLVKGLEVDTAIVVEPSLIFSEQTQGARSLYVACTRATKRLLLVHTHPLPELIR